MTSITLLTSAGAVRVAGEGLVIDIRNLESAEPSKENAIDPADGLSELMSCMFPETPANPSAPQARQADRAGEANPPASPAPQSKADMIRRLRPHCQHPGTDLCGGAGRNHCHSCKKLLAESEAA